MILLQHSLRSPRFLLLLRVMIKNRRPVLRAHVRPLPVHCSRVMTLPENRQQLQIRNLLRIKLHFHRLRVPGPSRANLFVIRILRRPARITHGSRSHPRHLPKRVLHSPKTTSRKRRLSHNQNSPSLRLCPPDSEPPNPILPRCRRAVEPTAAPQRAKSSSAHSAARENKSSILD